MPNPFDANPDELIANLDLYVDTVYEGLKSWFMVMPAGDPSSTTRGFKLPMSA